VLLSLVRVWFVCAMNMNGLSRPCWMTGPKRAPSMARPPAMRGSVSMAAAVAAPPREWPNMATFPVSRRLCVRLGSSLEVMEGWES